MSIGWVVNLMGKRGCLGVGDGRRGGGGGRGGGGVGKKGGGGRWGRGRLTSKEGIRGEQEKSAAEGLQKGRKKKERKRKKKKGHTAKNGRQEKKETFKKKGSSWR